MKFNGACPCKRACERHGKCDECMEYHKKNSKYAPSCISMGKSAKNAKSRDIGNENNCGKQA